MCQADITNIYKANEAPITKDYGVLTHMNFRARSKMSVRKSEF